MRARYVDMGEGSRGVSFWCPGCQETHMVRIAGPSTWTFNNSLDAPTIRPSVLVRTGHFTHNPPVKGQCYCDWSERYPDKEPMTWKCVICHSFVTDGKIHFLDDCSHELKGQTVDLPYTTTWREDE
jgi:hypothetical protein